MTNCASRFISVENPLDFVFFRPNPVGFVPVDFRMAYRTIEKFHVGSAFQFLPASLAVCLPQAFALADGFAGCDQFHILDASDNLEVHTSTTLPQKLQLGASPMSTMLESASAAWMEPASGFRLLASGLLATDSASRLPTPSGVPPAGRSLRLSNSSCCWPVRKRSWSQRKM